MNRICVGLMAATFSFTLSTVASASATTSNTTSTKVTPIQEAIKEASVAAQKVKESAEALKKAEDALKIATQAATTAKQSANKALSVAEQAFQKADADFNTAKLAADTAAKNLADAKTSVDTATKNFANAKTLEAAAKTKTEKDLAQKAVKDATTNLNAANTKLNDANNKFNSANTKLNDATTKRSAAEQVKNQASLQAKTVTENADNSVKAADDFKNQAKLTADNAVQYFLKAQEEAKKASDWSTMKRLTIKDRSEDKNFLPLIPQFQALVQKERVGISADKVEAQKLDFTQLFLKQKHNVRVWFINEGASYRNQLAYEAIKGEKYDKGMIFEDVSCNSTRNKCQLGEKDGVLDIGDFVDLGSFKAGTQLNFLLKADGYSKTSRNGDIYGADASLNPDGLQHLMAWKVGNYLMMGFEDLRKGGDKDYNDTVFVMDFGKNNFKTAAVPEPSATLPLLGLGALGMLKLRRRRVN
ncbi:DUF4114 domain-containing protein [Nostoc sp. FACHB-152]|uniref:DUF4114 domain-containing protein n=1 Tax=unclassified Nostoc TaxID=2593658 RepID=UPI001686F396|nr:MULTISPECIES: DUF4114 domain-containing protein [unclassified Nostoc]MBD2446423.1 DUF4114 domain-containing protein [Nostoc sp. FACHB-152]MBD2469622.1 DUF4114 domain-containing protein [Nostoc sp. FACHB-145]